MSLDTDKSVPSLESRLFNLLAHLWLYPVNPLSPKAQEALLLLAKDLGVSLPQSESLVPPLEEMQEEYTRLFINTPGGIPAPPYASAYEKPGLLCQGPWEESLSYYRASGLLPTGPEPADHLAYEISFLGHLLEKGRFDLLCDFLKNHLMKWFPAFKEALDEARPLAFYGFLASLTEVILFKIYEEVCS